MKEIVGAVLLLALAVPPSPAEDDAALEQKVDQLRGEVRCGLFGGNHGC